MPETVRRLGQFVQDASLFFFTGTVGVPAADVFLLTLIVTQQARTTALPAAELPARVTRFAGK